MPIGYLVTVVLFGCFTLAAVRPPRRPPALSAIGFRLSFVVSEFPLLAVCYLVGSTGLAVGEGDIGSPVGVAGLVIAGLGVIGVGLSIQRALAAGPALEQALDEGLGSGWRAAFERREPARGSPSMLRILLAPFLVRRGDVERVADISYGEAGRRNLLDVYRHRSHPAGGPVLVHLHGGRFVSGRKNRQSLPLIYDLASRGWMCVSANYRLSPAARFPDHLIDAKKVLAWVREHAHEYGADPAVVFVAGSSAGAHMAAMAALTADDRRFQPGFEDADTSVAGAICMGGYYGPLSTDREMASSPAAYARADAPPFFVIHGDLDTVVGVEGARLFVERLRDVSSDPVVYAELPGCQHAFDLFQSIRFTRVVEAVESFTAWVMSEPRQPVE